MILDADLRALLVLLTEHRVEYLVVGGHAVAFHGYPRFTEDLDLYVRAEPENASRVIAALEAFGLGEKVAARLEPMRHTENPLGWGREPGADHRKRATGRPQDVADAAALELLD